MASWDAIPIKPLAIQRNRPHSPAHVIRVLDCDVNRLSSEAAGDGEAVPVPGDAGIDARTVDLGVDAEDVLRGSGLGLRRHEPLAVSCAENLRYFAAGHRGAR